MANIQEDLQKILSSRYGKDVRQSIHDAISDINDEGIESRNIANDAKEVAITSRDSAQASAEIAVQKAEEIVESAETASQKATEATTASNTATQKATEATTASNAATEKATAAATSEANAKMWSDRAVDAAQSMSGGIVPRGSINFEDLPTIDDSSIGDLYIILDDFTSTTDFEDGGGHDYVAGTKIYLTSNYKWAVEPSSALSAADLLVTMDEL